MSGPNSSRRRSRNLKVQPGDEPPRMYYRETFARAFAQSSGLPIDDARRRARGLEIDIGDARVQIRLDDLAVDMAWDGTQKGLRAVVLSAAEQLGDGDRRPR